MTNLSTWSHMEDTVEDEVYLLWFFFLRNKLIYWEMRRQKFLQQFKTPYPLIRAFIHHHFTLYYIFLSLFISGWRTEMYRFSHYKHSFSIYQSLSNFIFKAMLWDDLKIDRENCLRGSKKSWRIIICCDYGLLRMV